MKISTISIDLAKSVFQLMMFDEQHKVLQEKGSVVQLFINLLKTIYLVRW